MYVSCLHWKEILLSPANTKHLHHFCTFFSHMFIRQTRTKRFLRHTTVNSFSRKKLHLSALTFFFLPQKMLSRWKTDASFFLFLHFSFFLLENERMPSSCSYDDWLARGQRSINNRAKQTFFYLGQWDIKTWLPGIYVPHWFIGRFRDEGSDLSWGIGHRQKCME